MKKNDFDSIKIPPNCIIINTIKINTNGKNIVYKCDAEINSERKNIFVKINNKNSELIHNEAMILEKLKFTEIKIPNLISYGDNFIITEHIPGDCILNLIDPKREKYDRSNYLYYLNDYGKLLAKVHNLSISHVIQKRTKLYDFIDDNERQMKGFEDIVEWINSNRPEISMNTFTHGDFNTANLLYYGKDFAGIIDWEFAGLGFKEFDLAWILRARASFLNSEEQYNAIIEGYSSFGVFNKKILNWCEIMVYLHFIYWCDQNERDYILLAKNKILSIIKNQ